MFAVGGIVGHTIGGMVGDSYFQRKQQSEQKDDEMIQAKVDWSEFIKDLMAYSEELAS